MKGTSFIRLVFSRMMVLHTKTCVVRCVLQIEIYIHYARVQRVGQVQQHALSSSSKPCIQYYNLIDQPSDRMTQMVKRASTTITRRSILYDSRTGKSEPNEHSVFGVSSQLTNQKSTIGGRVSLICKLG